jgi:hypothetical protein
MHAAALTEGVSTAIVRVYDAELARCDGNAGCVAEAEEKFAKAAAISTHFHNAVVAWVGAAKLYEDGEIEREELLVFAMEAVQIYAEMREALKPLGIDLPIWSS